MEQNLHDKPVYSKNVLDMLALANEYCLFIEKADEYSIDDLLNFIQKILPILYLKASLLPDITPVNEDANERFVTQEAWENTFNELRGIFIDIDEYYYINNSDIEEIDPIKASLSENLSDIYQDLKDFVMLYQKNTRDAKENAVFQCKTLFESHWGFRTVEALKYVHYQKFTELDFEQDIPL